MGNETKNYKFPKPSEDDFYDISEYNKAMDILDETLTDMNSRKLDYNGNASNTVTEFNQGILRENIESGEKLSVSHGKIQKWFSEMKNIAFSGLASDVTQDAAHRFVTDTEKNNWNAKVSASGGDISGTKIGSLEKVTSEFPVPAEGETSKVFLGKVKKFIEDTKGRYLENDVAYYVATTGSDDTGDGTQNKPFKTIQKAVNMVPKDLAGYTVIINVASGTYVEKLTLNGYFDGKIILIGPTSGGAIIDGGNKRHIISNNSCAVEVTYLQFKCPTATPAYEGLVICTNNSFLTFLFCTFDGLNTVETTNSLGVNIVGSIVELDTCIFNNCSVCIYSPVLNDKANPPGQIAIRKCTGNNNTKAYICQGSILQLKDNFLPTATEIPVIASGALVVLSTGALVGALQEDVVYYVASTGSDVTGDGTQAKPFRTIQKALSIIPKDLNGYTASIVVSPGTYDTTVNVIGYRSGEVIIRTTNPGVVSSDFIVTRFVVEDCNAYVHINGFKVIDSSSINAIRIYNCQSVALTYLQIISSSSNPGISCAATNLIRIIGCEISLKSSAIDLIDTIAYVWNCTGSGNTRSVFASGISTVSLIGTTPGSTNGNYANIGAQFIYENGTQISPIISSGLSCTWGTLTGGYVRHGNINGAAMVTIQIRVAVTVTLTAGNMYSILGFPQTYVDTAVNCNAPARISNCYFSNIGAIRMELDPGKQFDPGNILVFNCTYRTDN